MNETEFLKMLADLTASVKNSAVKQHELAVQVDRIADALYRSVCVIENLQSRVETLEKQTKS